MPVSDLPNGNSVRGRSADYSLLLEMKRRHLTVAAKTANPSDNKRPIISEGILTKGYGNGVVNLYFTRGLVKNYAKF
jgi:hypothetical protein